MILQSFVNKFYDVRPGEWLITTAMFFVNFFLMVILYFLKPARDSLFLVELGANQLPLVFILVAVVSIPVTQFVTRLVRRYNNFKVFLWTNVFVIANLLLLRGLFIIDQDWVYTVFYVWVSVYSILIISQFWVFANELYNTSQSKRLFSLLNMGAILGAIAGSQASSVVVSLLDVDTENLLYFCIAATILVLFIVYPLKGKSKFETSSGPSEKRGIKRSLMVYKGITKSRYQLIIACIIGIAMLISTLVDYQLKAVAADAYPDKDDLTSFMGTFYAGLSVASLLIQLLFSGRILRRMGIGGALAARPAGMLIASILLMFEPVLAVAVFLGGYDSATQYSIDKTSRELLFLPLTQKIKERIKLFLDVFVDRFSRGVAGFILLLLVTYLGATVQQLAWLVSSLLLFWLYMVWQAKREYVNQFRKSLGERYFDIESQGVDLREPIAVKMIKEEMHDCSKRKLINILSFLEGHDVSEFEKELADLLDHSSKEIRLKALVLLKRIHSADYSEQVKELLNSEDTELRLESIHYLCMHSERRADEVIKSYFDSDSLQKQAAAFGCVSRYGSEMEKEMVSDQMINTIIRNKNKKTNLSRAQIAQVLQYHKPEKARRYLPVLLNDPSPAVRKEAIKSMGIVKDEAFIPLLIQHIDDPDSSLEVREAITGYNEEYISLIASYYYSGDFNRRLCNLFPIVIAEFNKQESVDALLEMLGDEVQSEPRKNIIRGLNALRQNGEFDFPAETVKKELNNEFKHYLNLYAICAAVKGRAHSPIIEKALREKLDKLQENIFRLLGLLYNQKDMHSVYLGLHSQIEENRSKALELLDNLIEDDLRTPLFAIIDPVSETHTLQIAADKYDLSVRNWTEGLRTIMIHEDEWLRTCALYSVDANGDSDAKELLEIGKKDSSSMVKETAMLVQSRLEKKRNS
ncbi:MAG: Npt1/Npt2 family nucleotide transporter [Balneolaceae bacterium]